MEDKRIDDKYVASLVESPHHGLDESDCEIHGVGRESQDDRHWKDLRRRRIEWYRGFQSGRWYDGSVSRG